MVKNTKCLVLMKLVTFLEIGCWMNRSFKNFQNDINSQPARPSWPLVFQLTRYKNMFENSPYFRSLCFFIPFSSLETVQPTTWFRTWTILRDTNLENDQSRISKNFFGNTPEDSAIGWWFRTKFGWILNRGRFTISCDIIIEGFLSFILKIFRIRTTKN